MDSPTARPAVMRTVGIRLFGSETYANTLAVLDADAEFVEEF